MKRIYRNALLTVIILLYTCSFSNAQPVIDSFPGRVQVESGLVQGKAWEDVLSFKGIPYAAQPVGALRWRAPQPAPVWDTVLKATDFCKDCMQLPVKTFADKPAGAVGEDCLGLNIWRPLARAAIPLPVMVWIYGGAFVNGSTSTPLYDGSAFARDSIVFVSFNYRLGRFGFFAHPALSSEHPEEMKGNYGLMDQIAALKWIQRNIAQFGGDPQRVTLFGESAGGISVQSLLTSPVATGLFQQAIIQSGAGRNNALPLRLLDVNSPGIPSAETTGWTFGANYGIQGNDAAALADLRQLTAQQVLDSLNFVTVLSADPHVQDTYAGGPMIDRTLIANPPDVAYTAGTQARIPVIIGANSADIGSVPAATKEALFASFEEDAATARAIYDPDGQASLEALRTQVAADRQMVEPARYAAKRIASAGTTVYTYRFGYVADSLRSMVSGAPHASELPYVFHTLSAGLGSKQTAHDERMADLIHSYWANFVKTGDPNGTGLPHWPAYDPGKDELLYFGTQQTNAIEDPWRRRLDITERISNRRMER